MNPLAALLDRAGVVVLTASPTPSSSSSAPGGATHFRNKPDTSFSGVSGLTAVVGYIAWGVTAIAIVTLIGVGINWAISTHNGEQENLRSLGRWGMGALLAAAAGSIANTIFGFNLFTPHPQAVPGLSAVQNWLNIATTIGIAIGVIGLLLTAARGMLRHRQGEPMGESLLYVLVGCFIISGASGITYAVLPW
jgi:hypothetical protein